MKRRVKAKDGCARILQEDPRNSEEPLIFLKIGKPPWGRWGLYTSAAHPVHSVPICTARGQSRGCTSNPCGPRVVIRECPEPLAPPASPASLCCNHRWLAGPASLHRSCLSGAPLNPLKMLLGQVPSLPSGWVSSSSWACSSHTPAPPWMHCMGIWATTQP